MNVFVFVVFEVYQLAGVVFRKGVRFLSLFDLPHHVTVVLLHSLFVVLLGVADVAFAGVGAYIFIHYHSVSADVIIVALVGFVAMTVAWFIHEFQRLNVMHNFAL